MNVATLQQFLRSLAPALQMTDGGSRPAQDLERACGGLEPFRHLDLDAFTAFLARCEDYRHHGSVAVPSAFDASAILESLRRLQLQCEGLENSTENSKAELLDAQRELHENLKRLTPAAGLSGNLKIDSKWADEQVGRAKVRAHARTLRELAAQITEPTAFQRDDIRESIHRLEKEITAAEWKLLAIEFSLPPTTKGAKGLAEVLFKLTGHRAAKIKAAPKKKAGLDESAIAALAEPLKKLLERAKIESALPEAEVEQQLQALQPLSKEEVAAVARGAGIEKPGKSKKEVLDKLKGLLNAGRRVMDQTAH